MPEICCVGIYLRRAYIIMNSIGDLACNMQRMAINGVPPTKMSSSDSNPEFDASSFDSFMLTPASSVSSFGSVTSLLQHQNSQGSIKGFGSAISRSRCANNLSSLGSASSHQGYMPRHNVSGPNEGSWGYFVDSVPTPTR